MRAAAAVNEADERVECVPNLHLYAIVAGTVPREETLGAVAEDAVIDDHCANIAKQESERVGTWHPRHVQARLEVSCWAL